MCTVSWLRRRDGHELFCNRDERHTRKVASPPAVRASGGVLYVAPADGDHGGSWVGVNEYGLTLCLLNRYDDGWRPAPGFDYRSRGLLLTDLMGCRSGAAVRERLARAGLQLYQPFDLLALCPGEPSLLATWTGRQVSFESEVEPLMPLVSSSFRRAEVAGGRRDLLTRMAADAGGITTDVLLDFHRSHEPEPGPRSVCVHREDAATVSFSRVRVTAHEVELTYRPQSPCSDAAAETVSLPRKSARPA